MPRIIRSRRLDNIQNLFTPPRLRLKQTVSPARIRNIQVTMDMRVWRQLATLVESHAKLLCENHIDRRRLKLTRLAASVGTRDHQILFQTNIIRYTAVYMSGVNLLRKTKQTAQKPPFFIRRF